MAAPGAGSDGLAPQFRQHFGHHGHLYGLLLAELADDLDAGGPTAEVCRDHLAARREDAIHLRLLAGIQRLVLRGAAPGLAPWFADPDTLPSQELVRSVLLPVVAAHGPELRRALDQAPQTNEVGRSACLLVGLFEAVRRSGRDRVRLLEPGASAGLNLNVDRYRFTGPGWSWGPADSPLVLETQAAGVDPLPWALVDRAGCDLSPVDAGDPEGATYLMSFVWPFDRQRRHRLAAALEVVRRHPPLVERAPASAWLPVRLAEPVADDVVTVVWQSITQQYWPQRESAAVADTIARARERGPVVHVSLEGVPPAQRTGGYDIRTHGPQLRVDGDLVAHSHHHGPPLILEG